MSGQPDREQRTAHLLEACDSLLADAKASLDFCRMLIRTNPMTLIHVSYRVSDSPRSYFDDDTFNATIADVVDLEDLRSQIAHDKGKDPSEIVIIAWNVLEQPTPKTIEITQQMVDAGVAALVQATNETEDDEIGVRRIFQAMWDKR
jgi:hypothetical protein